MIRIISLGWGVQSWTMAAMSALGELSKVDLAIHSDTTWERTGTYELAKKYTPWLEKNGVKVVTVEEETAKEMIDEWGGVFIPAYTMGDDGTWGQLRRQCTHKWKIRPMRRYISDYLKGRGLSKTEGIVEQWMGITLDEWHRAKDSDVKYIKHQFPLLDLEMNRGDCILWLREHGLDIPPKSSCTFCPFHNNGAWEDIKREGGHDWKEAIMVDRAVRDKRPKYPLFVHPERLPLKQAVQIPEDYGAEQLELWKKNIPDKQCDSGYCFM